MDQGKSMVESTSNGHLPKRWKPNLEQRRILESIFATGTKNTRRERIAQITAVLQQYGRVEQRNVFYWFQNANNRNKLCRRRREWTVSEEFTNRCFRISNFAIISFTS
ncbi:WUSCHEL-related homeobox 6-like [Cryptomeria japonica]|uniref:WUSCHEL-related homeobox 6-like n=1 Tax=Cryptomeria japonica TaxID=3369 RepID=UPI0025AD7BA3|nr:WUSCHEL-related homeobox 6-like [Cryptomeria japonica]